MIKCRAEKKKKKKKVIKKTTLRSGFWKGNTLDTP